MISKKIALSTLVAGILSFGCGAQADGIKLTKTTDGSEFKIEGKVSKLVCFSPSLSFTI